MIYFKVPELAREWPLIHPDTRERLQEFDAFAVAHSFPPTTITDLIRDRAAQVRIYLDYYRRATAIIRPGPHNLKIEEGGEYRPATLKEIELSKQLRGKSVDQLEAMAAERFTWHWAWCATDLRTRDYSQAQLVLVKGWFLKHCPQPEWEFLVHDVTAPHLHIARRDPEWRARHSPDTPPNVA